MGLMWALRALQVPSLSCLHLAFSHHLSRVPALERVGVGWRDEGRELHLNTLVLGASGCGAGRAATLPNLAALISTLTTLSPFQLLPPRNGIQGVGCGCVLHMLVACEWYI